MFDTKKKLKNRELRKLKRFLEKLSKYDKKGQVDKIVAAITKKIMKSGLINFDIITEPLKEKCLNKHVLLGNKNTSNLIIDVKGQDNIIIGGKHDDVIYAGSGNDIVHGGDGNDTYVVNYKDTGRILIKEKPNMGKQDKVLLEVQNGYEVSFDYTTQSKWVIFKVGGKTVQVFNDGSTEELEFKDTNGNSIFYKWQNGKYVLVPQKNLTLSAVTTKPNHISSYGSSNKSSLLQLA